MALNFTVKVGDTVYVEGRSLLVRSSEGPVMASLETDDGREVHIQDDKAAEVYPDVLVSVGLKSAPGVVSLVFNAPREIRIWRSGHPPKDWNDGADTAKQ